MGSLRRNAWRLILAGGLAFFARGAAAQTGYSASDVAGMPGNACENLPMFNWNCPTCGGASTNVYSTLPQGMGDCDCQLESDNMSPFGVEQSMSQGFSAVLDSGAVHAGTVPGGCSSCGAGGTIPAASQMIRFQFPRIWRSTWTHDGSFGTGMYSGYDYYVAYTSAGTDSLVEIRDPNTGFIERFLPSSGTWIPTPGAGYGSSASYVSGGSANHVNIVQPGGTTLHFDQTGYVLGLATSRCRLTSIVDRNGNKVSFTYANPLSTTTPDVMELNTITDPYGHGVTSVSYTTFSYLPGLYVMSKVTFSDGRYVTYAYTSDNSVFVHDVEYFPSGGTATSGGTIGSTWYAGGTTVNVNEAMLPADHFNWQGTLDSTAYGRVRAFQRADTNYGYARAVSTTGDMNTITTWNQGAVRQLVRSPTKQLIGSRHQLTNGSWEPQITYSSSVAYGPPTGYTQPSATSQPARTTGAVRDPVSNMITNQTFADGGTSSSTYNGFNQPLTYVDQLSNTMAWTYDGSGNMLKHVVAQGTSVSATESWTYTSTAGSAGRVLTHTDFNGNVTGYAYYSASGGSGAAGELQAIVLAGSGTLQPSGTISFTYDGFGRVASVTDPVGRTVSFTYDEAGRLTQTLYPDTSTEVVTYSGTASTSAQVQTKADRNGNQTAFSYDSTGRVALVNTYQGSAGTGALMTSTSSTYDPTTGLLTSVNTDGQEMDTIYDYLNRVAATVVHPSMSKSLTSSNTFDRYNLLSTTDNYGRASKFYYDTMDRSRSTSMELTPGGTTIGTSAAFNKAGLLTDAYDGNNNHTIYLYDQRNRRTATIYAVGVAGVTATSSVTYDANSNVVKRTDERLHDWTSTYSPRDRVLTISDPLSNSSSNSYTADALVQSTTNANGNATSYTYKFCCPRLQYQTDALTFSKSYAYDSVGNTTGGTDESLRAVAYTFDGLNRQLTMTLDPGGSGSLNLTSSTAYYTPGSGSIGECSVTTTNAAGQQITTTLDGMGRTLSVSGNVAPTSYTYDAVVGSGSDAGLVVSTVTTGSGSTVLTTSAYADGAGRTVKTVDGLGKSSSMSYDHNNNLVLSIDRDARTVSNSYDARNRLTRSVLGATATTSYAYDATNNLTQVTDPDSKITVYGYDNANRRTSTTYAYSTSNATTWTMSYTPLGQLQVLTKPTSATITYSYEPRELLASRAYGGTAASATDSFAYYPNHLLSGGSGGIYNMNVSRGTAGGIGAWYDGANRLIKETQIFGGLTKTMTYGYTPDSLVSQIGYPDGMVIGRNYNDHRLLNQVLAGSSTQATFAYDPADRRSTMTYGNSAVTTWTLDNDSRITNQAVTLGGGTLQAWKYGYTDAGDPLSQNDLSFGTMGEAYQYDTIHRLAAGQRGQVTSGSNTIASPSSSQAWTLTAAGDWSQWISSAGTDNRTHNNLHALTARSVLTPSLSYDADWNQVDDATAYTFVYDANDQLQQVFLRDSLTLMESMAYDAFGRRTHKVVPPAATTTNYFYNGQQVVEQYINGSKLQAYYTYADGIDERIAADIKGSLYYFHANRLGSTYLLTNGSGGIVERYAYSPYGSPAVSTSAYVSSGSVSTVGNTYMFTGREFDGESLLYNYRARTYDPVQGRFKQLDPIALSGRIDLYQYVSDSPVRFADPSGMKKCAIAFAPTPARDTVPDQVVWGVDAGDEKEGYGDQVVLSGHYGAYLSSEDTAVVFARASSSYHNIDVFKSTGFIRGKPAVEWITKYPKVYVEATASSRAKATCSWSDADKKCVMDAQGGGVEGETKSSGHLFWSGTYSAAASVQAVKTADDSATFSPIWSSAYQAEVSISGNAGPRGESWQAGVNVTVVKDGQAKNIGNGTQVTAVCKCSGDK